MFLRNTSIKLFVGKQVQLQGTENLKFQLYKEDRSLFIL